MNTISRSALCIALASLSGCAGIMSPAHDTCNVYRGIGERVMQQRINGVSFDTQVNAAQTAGREHASSEVSDMLYLVRMAYARPIDPKTPKSVTVSNFGGAMYQDCRDRIIGP